MNLLNKLLLLTVCVAASSCTDNFEEINTDPNRPKEIYPGVLLSQLQYKMVNNTIGGARNFTHEIMQVTAPRVSPVGGLHRYNITASTGTSFWNNTYQYMTDVEDLYTLSDRLFENNYKGIALIYKAWAYSLLTDCFGYIPYSEAIRVTDGIFKPAFDDQQSIYLQTLNDLETANELLDDTKGLTYGGDMVYNALGVTNGKSAGVTKWKKFCNSLRLRLLLRIINRDGEVNVSEQINMMLADPLKYPTFTSNTDEAIFRYPGTYPYFNPYYNARTLDWREGTYYTKFFIDYLNQTNDPRRAVWATTVKVDGQNVYQGIESGYESDVEYVVGANSSYSDGLKTLPQLGIMMTYAEMEFIKAELAVRGFSTGSSARTHYEKGITASMVQWGVSMPADFLQQEGVLYDADASVEEQLKRIIQQKYYALYFTDYESWFDKRRTGYPELERGPGIPDENQFPSRMMYPTYLQSLNAENLENAKQAMGGDLSTIKAWWEN